MVEVLPAAHEGGDHGIVAAKEISGGEQGREEKDTAAQAAVAKLALREGDFVLVHAVHGYANFPAAVKVGSSGCCAGRRGQRARTLEPPLTFCPTFTRSSASWGSQRSTREPKRTRPTRSPRATVSPGFFQETTRRATQPAICLNSRLPVGVARVKTFCSFCREAPGSHAARNLPGR